MFETLAINPLWISFGPVVVINAILLCSIVYYKLSGASEKYGSAEAARRSKSIFLSYFFKEWWLWLNEPIAQFFIRIGLTPNIISSIGFFLACVAAWLFAIGLFGYAGWVMVFGATFDFFDGRVARLTNQMTRSGAFYDSTIDRFGEAVCFLGVAYFFRDSWAFIFVIAALIGSMMVSYTRARGQAIGVDCNKGSMQRPERVVYLGVSSILQPVATLLIMPFFNTELAFLVIAALLLMAVMTNATAIFRMIDIMKTLDAEDIAKGENSTAL